MSALPTPGAGLSLLAEAWIGANAARIEAWATAEKFLRENGGGQVWSGEINCPHGHSGPTKFTRVEITREGE